MIKDAHFEPEKPNFKQLVLLSIQQLTNFPYIEADFDAITNYQLLCKVVEYLNQVISNNNIQNETITELYNSFVALEDYINNYFDNLDVQEEINNKLDEMVADGTISEIITPYMDNLLSNVIEAKDEALLAVSTANSASANANNMVNHVGTIVDKLRYNLSREYTRFEFPETMNEWFKNITILKAVDKNNYNYILDLESLKNSGGSTIYVDCNNSSTGDGTQANPYKSFADAFNDVNDGDTIIVKKGVYYRQQLNSSSTQAWKNINIICDENTLFTTGQSLTWSQNSTYNNVYQASRTNVASVIDIRNRDRGLLPKLKNVGTLQACANEIYTYYTDNSIIYVNLGEEVNDDKILCSLKLGYRAFNIRATSRNLHVYIKNATFIGGRDGIIRVEGNDTYDCEFIAENCRFLYSPISSIDGLPLTGAKSILVKCEASFNQKDGFNYHSNESTKCYGIEVDCIAQANGLGESDHSYNGSTIHDGGQILRIGGNYFNNNGGNITDIDSNTISINIECNAFDSLANTEDEYSTDFCCKYGTAKMYLYNCFAQGNSYKNMYCYPSTATMTLDNCKYDSTSGSGTINIIE